MFALKYVHRTSLILIITYSTSVFYAFDKVVGQS